MGRALPAARVRAAAAHRPHQLHLGVIGPVLQSQQHVLLREEGRLHHQRAEREVRAAGVELRRAAGERDRRGHVTRRERFLGVQTGEVGVEFEGEAAGVVVDLPILAAAVRELAKVEGRRGEILEADHAEEERLGRRHRRRQRQLQVGVDRIVVGGRQRVGGAEAPVEEERRAVERVREDAVAPRRHALLLFGVHARVPVEDMGRECAGSP